MNKYIIRKHKSYAVYYISMMVVVAVVVTMVVAATMVAVLGFYLVFGFLALMVLMNCKSSSSNSNCGCNLLFYPVLVSMVWVLLYFMFLKQGISTSGHGSCLPKVLEVLVVLHLLCRVVVMVAVVVVAVVVMVVGHEYV